MRLTNRLRDAIDSSQITFYSSQSHPDDVPTIDLESEPATAGIDEVTEFLKTKAYWLAFKQSGNSAKVWIADPWDAVYLGAQTRNLLDERAIDHESCLVIRDLLRLPCFDLLPERIKVPLNAIDTDMVILRERRSRLRHWSNHKLAGTGPRLRSDPPKQVRKIVLRRICPEPSFAGWNRRNNFPSESPDRRSWDWT
jgi:hypothetical protein